MAKLPHGNEAQHPNFAQYCTVNIISFVKVLDELHVHGILLIFLLLYSRCQRRRHVHAPLGFVDVAFHLVLI